MKHVLFVALFASGSIALAQVPPLRGPFPGNLTAPGRFPGGFGGVSADQFFRSNVSLAANQLLSEIQSVRAGISQSNAPFATKLALSRQADIAVRAAQNLTRLAQGNADRNQLLAADLSVDQSVEQLLQTIAQTIVPQQGLADAIARAQYADTQLHAAMGLEGTSPDDRLARLIRSTSAAIDQSELLRALAQNLLGGSNLYERQLDVALRGFGTRLDRMRRNLDSGGTVLQAGNDYQLAAQQWQIVTQGLSAGVRLHPALRLQAARVDGLFQSLGEQLQQSGNPGTLPLPNPGFGFTQRGIFAVGAGEGGGPRVRVYSDLRGAPLFDFFAYDQNFRGGVRVAVADINGDGIPDIITAPGGAPPGTIGIPPFVRVFDGRTMRLASEFLAYDRNWTGGVFVAASDMQRNGRAIVVTGGDVGAGPHVRAFDISTGKELDSFFAYDQNYRGGVRVAIGDVDGDGLPDIVTAPGPQHEPRIRVFGGNNRRVLADFLAYDRNWTGGCFVSTADITKNGRAEILVGSDVGGPGVARVFDALQGKMLGEIAPYPAKFRGGIRVAAHDVDGDGILDVICAPGPDYAAPVRVFSGVNSKPLGEFFPFEANFGGGAFVGGK